jgi:NAD(P)-dependent dehydrogenase (short-subunit alcohol dehydrogenase family)
LSALEKGVSARHDGQVVVVTGGGGGIGSAISEEFARDGARVAVWDVSLDAAEAVAAGIDGARPYEVDISDSAAVDAATRAVLGDFGGLRVLVNNAGISRVGDHTTSFPTRSGTRRSASCRPASSSAPARPAAT